MHQINENNSKRISFWSSNLDSIKSRDSLFSSTLKFSNLPFNSVICFSFCILKTLIRSFCKFAGLEGALLTIKRIFFSLNLRASLFSFTNSQDLGMINSLENIFVANKSIMAIIIFVLGISTPSIGLATELYDKVLSQNTKGYLNCEALKSCTENSLSRVSFKVYFKDDGQILNFNFHCTGKDSALAFVEHDLTPPDNQENPCVDPNHSEPLNNEKFNELISTAEEINKMYQVDSCSLTVKQCFSQVKDSFKKDWKYLFSKKEDPAAGTEVGCIGNFLSKIKTDFKTTLKFVFHDIPQFAGSLAKTIWNSYFNKQDNFQKGEILRSFMGESIVSAVEEGNTDAVYDSIKKNFRAIIEGLKDYYGGVIGCTKWEGDPYESKCLQKANALSCNSCDDKLNLICGILAEAGGFALLGGAVAVPASMIKIAKLTSVGKKITNASKFTDKITDLRGSTLGRRVTSNISFDQKGTSVLNSILNAGSYFRGAANEFLNWIAVGPPLSRFVNNNWFMRPYSNAYRNTKLKIAKVSVNRYINRPMAKSGHKLLSKRGRALLNINEAFDQYIKGLYLIRGKNFTTQQYNRFLDNYFGAIKKELETGLGFNVKKEGQHLIISKEGQRYTYRPNFQKALEKDKISLDDFTSAIKKNDPFLDKHTDFSTKGPLHKLKMAGSQLTEYYQVTGDGVDGLVYMTQIGRVLKQADGSNLCKKPENLTILKRIDDNSPN